MESEKITTPAEQSTENPPQNPQIETQMQEQIAAGVKELYPDREFTAPEEMLLALIDDLKAAKQIVGEMEGSNKQVYEMIASNPVLSDIIEALGRGEPFEVALAKNVDLEALTPLEGEEQYEAYRKAASDRSSRKAEIAKKRESFEANQTKTKADAETFFAKHQMDEAEQAEFLNFIEEFLEAMFKGEVSEKTLEKMYQAFRYEEAIAEATEQGAVDGRNAQIEAKRKTTTATDGVPNQGTAVAAPEPAVPKKKIFNI